MSIPSAYSPSRQRMRRGSHGSGTPQSAPGTGPRRSPSAGRSSLASCRSLPSMIIITEQRRSKRCRSANAPHLGAGRGLQGGQVVEDQAAPLLITGIPRAAPGRSTHSRRMWWPEPQPVGPVLIAGDQKPVPDIVIQLLVLMAQGKAGHQDIPVQLGADRPGSPGRPGIARERGHAHPGLSHVGQIAGQSIDIQLQPEIPFQPGER